MYKKQEDVFETTEAFVKWYNNKIHEALCIEIGGTLKKSLSGN
jgi:hypothetical protein